MRAAQRLFGCVPLHALRPQIDQHYMRVRPACDDIQPALHQLRRQRLRVLHHLRGIGPELRPQRLAKGHGLRGDHMHQRATLDTGEDRRIDLLRKLLIIGQDHPAARPAQGLVRRRRRDMGMREGRGMLPARDQTREMRHVHHQPGADAVRDLTEAGKVDDARHRRPARDDKLRLVFLGQRRHLIIVDAAVLRTHPVLDRVEPLAGLVRRRAMRQMPARGEVHAKDRVAGLQQRREHTLIGLTAGIRLHIGKVADEKRLRPVDGKVFGHIDELATAVIAPSGVALGILVRQHGPLRLHHRAADDVLRRDQLDLIALAGQFAGDRAEKLRVAGGQCLGEKTGVAAEYGHVVFLL